MPGYDGTGPEGRGPNGRGLGPCGTGRAGQGNRRFFGFGRRGGRRGFWRFGAEAVDPDSMANTEKDWLERQREIIENRLKALNND